jgi:hypothetical protein
MHHCCAVGKVVSLSFLSGTTPGATPLFETSPSLQIEPLAHDPLTLITPRLTAFGRVFEIPDAELWRRRGGSESGKASKAMITASQPPKWTGREGRTPSPRACYVSSWGNRWRLLAAADCWSLRSDDDMQQYVSGSEGDVYPGRLHSLRIATCLEAAPGPRPPWAILQA